MTVLANTLTKEIIFYIIETYVAQHKLPKGDEFMPPKPRIDTSDVVTAAVSIVRNDGIEHVNARSIAKVMHCSTKPLFRLYKSMDELKQDVFMQMNIYCSTYLREDINIHQDSIGLAMRYIRFAKMEPNIFKALFMNHAITQATISTMLIDDDIKGLINEIASRESLSKKQAQEVYKRMWLLSHGIASLLATNRDVFELDEVESMLTDTYRGIVMLLQNGG